MNCHLEHLPIFMYTHMFLTSRVWHKSEKMENYRKCTKMRKGMAVHTKKARQFLQSPFMGNHGGIGVGNYSYTSNTAIDKIDELTPEDLNLDPGQIMEKLEKQKANGTLYGVRLLNQKPVTKPKLKAAQQAINSDLFPFKVAECLPLMTDMCTESSIVTVKSIRLRMDMVPDLLKLVPNLKIIHYARNPRGILNSREKSFRRPKKVKTRNNTQENESKLAHLSNKAKLLCTRMLNDIQVRKELEKSYPNVIFYTQYELLASQPNATVSAIYDFLGQDPPQEVLDSMWIRTHDTHNNGPIGTKRSNATSTAYAWRTQMSPRELQVVSQQCKELDLELGYEKLKTGI